MFPQPVFVGINLLCLQSFVSSANRYMSASLLLQTSVISLMNIINISGPNTLPCGIPLLTYTSLSILSLLWIGTVSHWEKLPSTLLFAGAIQKMQSSLQVFYEEPCQKLSRSQLTTDRHEASRGFFATTELFVTQYERIGQWHAACSTAWLHYVMYCDDSTTWRVAKGLLFAWSKDINRPSINIFGVKWKMWTNTKVKLF